MNAILDQSHCATAPATTTSAWANLEVADIAILDANGWAALDASAASEWASLEADAWAALTLDEWANLGATVAMPLLPNGYILDQAISVSTTSTQRPIVLNQIIYLASAVTDIDLPTTRDQTIIVGRQQSARPTWNSFTALDWFNFSADTWKSFDAAEPIDPATRQAVLDQSIVVRPATTTTLAVAILGQNIYTGAA